MSKRRTVKFLGIFLAAFITLSFVPSLTFAQDYSDNLTGTSAIRKTHALQQEETESANNSGIISSKVAKGPDIDSIDRVVRIPTGHVVNETLKANTSVKYVINQTSGYYNAYHVYLINKNSGENDYLTQVVVDSDDFAMVPSTCYGAYYNSDETLSSGDTAFTIPGETWHSELYHLYEGDAVVLTAGDNDVNFSLVIQEVETSSYGSFGEFEKRTLYSDAALIRLDRSYIYENDCAAYLENVSYYNICYYFCSEHEMLKDHNGFVWGWLKPNYNNTLGFKLDPNEDYYLLVFLKTDSTVYQADDYEYEESEYYDDEYYDDDDDYYDDDEYYDYYFTVTPRNMKYYELEKVGDRTYTGKPCKQNPNVCYGNTILGSRNYSIKYSNNTKVGKATMIISGEGPCYGTLKKSFNIVPKGTSISKIKASKKGFTVKWKKQTKQTSGYQIQYSLKKNFSGAKTITVKNNKSASKKINKLKSKKKYYVRVRTYKTVSGKKYCSAWSKAKAVKTK